MYYFLNYFLDKINKTIIKLKNLFIKKDFSKTKTFNYYKQLIKKYFHYFFCFLFNSNTLKDNYLKKFILLNLTFFFFVFVYKNYIYFLTFNKIWFFFVKFIILIFWLLKLLLLKMNLYVNNFKIYFFVIFTQIFILVLSIWTRAAGPRTRIDQLNYFTWKEFLIHLFILIKINIIFIFFF